MRRTEKGGKKNDQSVLVIHFQITETWLGAERQEEANSNNSTTHFKN